LKSEYTMSKKTDTLNAIEEICENRELGLLPDYTRAYDNYILVYVSVDITRKIVNEFALAMPWTNIKIGVAQINTVGGDKAPVLTLTFEW